MAVDVAGRYADRISNTVVDALGDVAGGIRLSDTQTQEG